MNLLEKLRSKPDPALDALSHVAEEISQHGIPSDWQPILKGQYSAKATINKRLRTCTVWFRDMTITENAPAAIQNVAIHENGIGEITILKKKLTLYYVRPACDAYPVQNRELFDGTNTGTHLECSASEHCIIEARIDDSVISSSERK